MQIQDSALINNSQIYEVMKHNGYSVENALGEIVDNAMESGASEIRVYFRTTQKDPDTSGEIIVLDNGSGMSPEVLGKCMVLGCSMWEHKFNRLGIGRFGLGMVLGSISLARHVDVYSRDTTDGAFYKKESGKAHGFSRVDESANLPFYSSDFCLKNLRSNTFYAIIYTWKINIDILRQLYH